ncbi:hypothetical protein D3C76_1858230 [compost metagenome]
MHTDGLRRIDAETHVVAIDGDNADGNVVTDGNLFADNATEYKHGLGPLRITEP